MSEGWEYKKLGEVCDIINGLWTGKKEPFINIAVIRNTNFSKDCQLKLDNVAYIDVEAKQFAYRKLLYGDIIIEKSGGSEKQPVGRPVLFNIPEGDYSFSNFTSTLRIKKEVGVEPTYLYRYLYAFYCQGGTNKFQSKTTGLHNLNMKGYLRIDVPIPPKSTQLAIVAELDQINDLIRLKKEQLKEYDNLAQSIFYDMFGDPVENEKGWEVKKLGDVCEIGTGSTPNRKNKRYYVGNIPWVKSTEVCNGFIKETQEMISDEALAQTNCTIYPKDSVLIAMYGQGKTRGQVAILKIDACTNQAVAAMIPSESISTNFLFYHLRLLYENIRGMARGGNQANLNLTLVKSIKIILPPLPLQQEFSSRVEQIEQLKTEVRKTITDLETLLAARMQYWFE